MWTESDDRCPICNALLWELYDYMDTTLMEHLQECRNCKLYDCSFVWGDTQMFIGVKEFVWGRNTPAEEVERIQADIDAEIELLRKEIAS